MPVSREASLLVAGSRLLSRTPHCVADAQTRGVLHAVHPNASARPACLAGAGATLRPAAERLHAASHAEPVHAGAEPAVPGHQAAVECGHVGQYFFSRLPPCCLRVATAVHLSLLWHAGRHACTFSGTPLFMTSVPPTLQARAAASPCTLTVIWR